MEDRDLVDRLDASSDADRPESRKRRCAPHVLGMIDGRHWTAITTKRGKRIRIISVRRSRKNEEAYHESKKIDAKAITSDQLEEMFDNGDDILSYVDLGNPVAEHHPRWRSESR